MLIAVAYAHVLLELAAAMLAVAIGVRLLVPPVGGVLCERARRCRAIDHRPEVIAVDRRSADEVDRGPDGRVS
jgi:hypothetical protein